MNAAVDIEKFREDGFALVPGLLDVGRLITPLRQAYKDLFDTLIHILLNEVGNPAAVKFDDVNSAEDSFATLLGLGGKTAFAHLNPSNCLASGRYQFRRDFPNALLPQLFAVNFEE